MNNECENKTNENFKIPICIFVFKRTDIVKQLFDILKRIKPEKIYVFSDGPRDCNAGEKKEIDEVRSFIESLIDWNCEKSFNYSEINKGCDKNISDGLTELFSKESEAIVFEDDVLPIDDFFPYCEYLLKKYKNEKIIQYIAGFNGIGSNTIIEEEYTFGKTVPLSGAFATWSDRWNDCDLKISDWRQNKKQINFKQIFYFSELRKDFINSLDNIYNGKTNVWDYKFDYEMYKSDKLAIAPKNNLATNYVMQPEATHPIHGKEMNRLFIILKSSCEKIIFPLNEPKVIDRNKTYDKERQRKMLWVNGNIIQRRTKKVYLFFKDILYKYLPRSIWKTLKNGIVKD